MKRLNFYIGRNLLQTTLAAIAIVTFVLICGSFLEMFELLSRGVSWWTLLRFIGFNIPKAMGFALPLAILAASVIVFSRMSADQEVTAMRASGVGLWQIVSPGLLLAALASALCFYLHGFLIPECRMAASHLRRDGEIGNPVAFLEPGRMIQLAGCIVYVGDREDDRIEDIQLYILDENDQIAQDIYAERGRVSYDDASKTMVLHLERAMFGIVHRDGKSDDAGAALHRMRAETIEIPVRLFDEYRSELLTRGIKELDLPGLIGLANLYEQHGFPPTPVYMQVHKRLVMSLSPVAFLLMGIPFGIRTKRSETIAGIVVSLVLALFFYVFIALADSLAHQAWLYPEIIIWLPIILYQAGGLLALHRIAAR